MDLSIIIPVYNEEECITISADRLISAVRNSYLSTWNVEFIFVNDGSTDQTRAILNQLSSERGIRVLHLSRNFGHSIAVLAGLEKTQGNVVAIIDADMQDPPELIPEMIKKLSLGYDVVYGQRISRKGESIFKKASAWAFYRVISSMASVQIPKDTGDFRVMTREVVDAVLSCRDQVPFIRGLVAWVGFDQVPYPYHREERKLGTTKYPLSKMMKFAWLAISSFSNTPLLLITQLGLLMLVLSLVGFWLGWNSLLLGIVAGNALTLLMLGVIGLYLGKVIDQVRGRPRYILRKESSEQTQTPDSPNSFPNDLPAHLGLSLSSLGESDRNLH